MGARPGAGDRAARSQALPRPIADYAGAYESRAYGRLTLTVAGGRLHARIGALDGPVEAYDAAKEKLRLDLGGAGFVAEMAASADGVSALILEGSRFDRAAR